MLKIQRCFGGVIFTLGLNGGLQFGFKGGYRSSLFRVHWSDEGDRWQPCRIASLRQASKKKLQERDSMDKFEMSTRSYTKLMQN